MQELQALRDELRSHGLTIEPALSGKTRQGAEWCFVRRFHIDGKEIILAWYGDYSKKLRGEWKSASIHEMSDEARKQAQEQISLHLAEERREREAHWEIVARDAELLWQGNPSQLPHPYLEDKKLSGLHGVKIITNEQGYPVLLVPMRDVDGKLWNVTRIYSKKFEHGNKFVLPGGRKEGLFHIVGGVGLQNTCDFFFLTEGFATASSISEALSKDERCLSAWGGRSCVVACFDADNLVHVARALKKEYPNSTFFICADDDIHKPESGNAGREKGLLAAKACKAENILFPTFKSLDTKPTDFNDLACLEGLPTVAEQIYNPRLPDIAPKTKEEKQLAEDRVVKAIIKESNGLLIRQGKDLFEYTTKGYWEHLDPDRALSKYYKLIDFAANSKWKHKDIMSAYSKLVQFIPHVPDGHSMFSPNPLVVGFSNGALHLIPKPGGKFEMKLCPHDPKNLLVHCHPFPFEKIAKPNNDFLQAVGRVLGEGIDENYPDSLRAYKQILGACLMPGAFRKLVFFVGKPKSGKSTLILFAWQLIDRRFRCMVDPTQMHGFNMETMVNKLLNCDPDITLTKPLSDSVLKKIEDGIEIKISRKGIQDIYGRIPGMHIFGGNGMPKTSDGVAPYDRRMLIMKCDYYQAPDGFNRNFVGDVWEANPGGIVAAAIEGLEELCASGGHFTVPHASKEKMKVWAEDNADAVQDFVRALEEGDCELKDQQSQVLMEKEGKISRKMLWDTFKSWFDVYAPRALIPNQKVFYMRLRDLGIHDKKSGNVRYFTGFSVKASSNSQF